MRVKFYLKRPQDKETSIFASVTHSYNRMKVYTGITVEKKYWNKKAHRVMQTPGYRQYGSINNRLDRIKGMIEEVFHRYVETHDKEPSFATFKKLIDLKLGRTREVKLSFFEYYRDFISRTETGQRRNSKGKIIKKSSAYVVTLNNLKSFADSWGTSLDFDTIDLEFYEDYLKFLQRKNLSDNTIGREIKNLKAVLNDATERGFNTNLAFRSKRFTKPHEEVDNITLHENELKLIRNLVLSDRPHLDHARDLFLIGCYTGLRISDYMRLKEDNFKDGFITIKQMKTGNDVVIPEHAIVADIREKYQNKLPTMADQKLNEYIKDVCKMIPEMHKSETIEKTKGGVTVVVNKERWQLTSSHTARRTFATNSYLRGIPSISIMAITGHKTEKNFLKYIKISPRKHAKIMAEYWNRQNMKIAK